MAVIQNDVLCLNTLLGIYNCLEEPNGDLFKTDHAGRNAMHIAVQAKSTEIIKGIHYCLLYSAFPIIVAILKDPL